jgi:hypothetical protein
MTAKHEPSSVNLKTALLKAFLLRCEACGWIASSFGTADGKLAWFKRKEARSYWVGVRVTLAQVASPLAFDSDLADLAFAPDPFVSATQLFRELCAQRHEGVAK